MNKSNSSKSNFSPNNSDELKIDIFDTEFSDNNESLVIITQDQATSEQMSYTEYKTPQNSIDHLENDNSLEKTLDLKSQVLEFLKDLKKIVYENTKRCEIFKKYQGTSVSKIEVLQSYNSVEDINLYMEEMKEHFVNSLNISYNVMREMDQNLFSKSFEIKNIRSELTKKNSEIETLGKSLRNEKKPDMENKHKSLIFEATNRKNQIHINQLQDDLMEVEKELEELKAEKRLLKNQIRQLDAKYEDKEYEFNESQENVKRLTNENKKLKSSLKKYQVNEENVSDESKEIQMQLEMKDKSIINLQNEICEKEKEVNFLQDSIREKESLQKDESLVSEHIQVIGSLRDELENQKVEMTSLNIAKENIENDNHKLKETLEKVQKDLDVRCRAVELLKNKVKDFKKIEKEIQENNRLNKKVSSLEIEIKNLTLERDEHKNNFNTKVSECEKLKKEKFGYEKEIHNLKLLTFKKG